MAYDIDPFDGGGDQGAKRLLALANHLETLKDEDYDHYTWRRQRRDGSWVMCALGHGVSAMPEAIGLRWREPGSADVVRLDGSGITQNTLTLAAEAFGITIDEAATMFGIGPYAVAFYGAANVWGIKPKSVAAAIRSFALAKLAPAPRRLYEPA
jgi:hypothetical protein